ncbi:divalent metal cation transporter [Candidatus Nomurabacteria bacterium]|nr:divalent metal cation transporter [Candidatus Nomurabacteria bacterium]
MEKIRGSWKILGPGLTTGAADDDPSGIATYSQAGAQHGFRFLWMSVLSFPLMAVVQEMCARIALVTGRGLAANIRLHFPRKMLYGSTGLLFFANALNIGADLGMMAAAAKLLIPQMPFAFGVIFFAVFSLILQIFIPYNKYAKILKFFAFVLLAYIVSALLVDLPLPEILRGTFIPTIHFDKDTLLLITAILGTTISPYLFFWQTSQEVEEQIKDGKTRVIDRMGTTAHEVRNMRIDVWFGMFFSNIVMFFIIAACAATLHKSGVTNITSAADAAQALLPIAGPYASLLFTVGIIGTGLLAIPVLAGSTAYAMAESFRWKEGLFYTLRQARAFYGIIIISVIVGLLINFFHLDPIRVLIFSAVCNGIIAPFIIFFIVKISSNKKIMGEWVNSRSRTFVGWTVFLLMVLAAIGALYSLL